MRLGQLDGEGPVYRQLYRALRRSILAGELQPETRLPSTRWVAAEYGLSRNRAVLAYSQLLDEGYVVGRIGSGTYVAADLPDEGRGAPPRSAAAARRRAGARVSRAAARIIESTTPWNPHVGDTCSRFDFRYGRPSYCDFPHSVWRRLVVRAARASRIDDFDYLPVAGLPDLREAIARHLGRWRGIECSPEQVLVVNGSQQGLMIAANVLLDPGDRVALEEPHYPGVRVAVASAGAEIVPVPVDGKGFDPDALPRGRGRLRLLCVTPSHQFPTGSIMPLARRLALLALAERAGAHVIEDDYDSEYRYTGSPLQTLHALDRAGRVIYLGTFSKILFPSLRIGYVVVPAGLERPFRLAKAAADFGTAALEQRVLAEFLRRGHLDVHLRRSRRRHAARRTALLEAIDHWLASRVEVLGADAGLHVVLVLRNARPGDVPEIVRRARDRDVVVYPTRPFYLGKPRRAELLLGHGSLSEDEMREGIRRLADVVP